MMSTQILGNTAVSPDTQYGTFNRTTLNLLLFSVSGVSFGIDASQVAGISAYCCCDSPDENTFWFHEEIGFGKNVTPYQCPVIMTLKTTKNIYRVIIDAMEDISEFSLNDIRVLPAFLEPIAMQRGIWGVIPRRNTMVMLLDFMRLPRWNVTVAPPAS